MILDRIPLRWPGRTVIVAATGPSLTAAVAEQCVQSGHPIIAVNNAYKLLPSADILYSCDGPWWDLHEGAPGFLGERWSSHDDDQVNGKLLHAARHGLTLVRGKAAEGFSTEPTRVHYGSNSGFQAINLAMHFGAQPIVLVGFNMQWVAGLSHFFGDHPRPLRNPNHFRFVPIFEQAAKMLPPGVEILNATPDSALTCFPYVPLAEALKHRAGSASPTRQETVAA